MTNYLLGYFILSALVAAFVAAQEYEGFWRIGRVVLLVALGPVLAVGQVALDALEWLDKYGQVKTFCGGTSCSTASA
jgi:biotin transporter BioY